VLRNLNLNPEESFIASRFERETMTLETLNMLTGLPEEKIARTVYALSCFGAIELKSQQPVEKPVLIRKHEVPNIPPPQPPKSALVEKISAGPPPKVTQPQEKPTSARNPEPSRPQPAPPQAIQTQPGANQLKSEAALRDTYLLELQRKRFTHTAGEETATVEPKVRMEVQKSEKMKEAEQHVKIADQFFRLAEKKFEGGDYYNVTSLCKQAIQNNPGEAKYYYLMALAYSKHPRFLKDAQISYEKAIELDPWNPDYHVKLAEFYIDQGLSLRASNQIKKALTITPQHKQALELQRRLKGRK
jgi:tetratricopeptide (TPR) repeat protein